MNVKDKKIFKSFVVDLTKAIDRRKKILFVLNKGITFDTDYYIKEDYNSVKSFLYYLKDSYPQGILKKTKPKGRILIILSYNEPFIMSVIPVVNALIAGNNVIVKVSGAKTKEFMDIIWKKSGIVAKYSLDLKIVCIQDHNKIPGLIKKAIAVYFFGSYKVAQIISKICGENYVEFYPAVEAADIKIFNKNFSLEKNDPLLTIRESFTHSGQTCQRIQGILVHNNYYEDYVKDLKKRFLELCRSENLESILSKDYASKRNEMLNGLLLDIDNAKPDEVIKETKLPILVINPDMNSEFVKKAYFLPVLWISRFNSNKELLGMLNSRKFFLGLNIKSDDEDFINHIVNNTRFTRYTINNSHTDIRPEEGWGGSWPSGYSGYKSWLEHFSDNYTVIR